MGVCETVEMAAQALVRAKVPQDARHRLLAEILRLMPLYRDANGLADWEMAFRGVLAEPDDESEIGELLYQVYEFGCENMYGNHNAQASLRAFARLSERFRQSGIVLDTHRGLDDW
jgi:hypothetical protein